MIYNLDFHSNFSEILIEFIKIVFLFVIKKGGIDIMTKETNVLKVWTFFSGIGSPEKAIKIKRRRNYS